MKSMLSTTETKPKNLKINGKVIRPGSHVILDIPIAHLYTHTPIDLPVQVIHGKEAGACLFISAAIHGDELNGVEIIRRLLKQFPIHQLKGTLIAIPIVNVFGLLSHSRYLPDRRDLNRSFPGSEEGSLAARLAYIFMNEIVAHCTHGIDLHTGAFHRYNLPQIRANFANEETERLAQAFNAPVMLHSTLRDGSLREAASEQGVKMLLYEAGEALRFDELCIQTGLEGIFNVMRELGMLPTKRLRKHAVKPLFARSSTWVRAQHGGILRSSIGLGQWVKKQQLLGIISDPFDQEEIEVFSTAEGMIISMTKLPLVNEGDALFHIARIDNADADSKEAGNVDINPDMDELERVKQDDPPVI